MGISFHTFRPDTGDLVRAPGEVTAYPGGDTAVRHLEPAPAAAVPVVWNTGGTLDYAALGQWVAFHDRARLLAGDGEKSWRPVLVMPYLPSARGDHDITGDAQAAARLTAATGVRHVIAADPHSDAWADAAADWGLTVHDVTAAELIAGSTLTAPHWDWTAVIAPDRGAIERAGDVASALELPLLTAGKVRDSATGKLSSFTAPAGIGAGRFLVVDDICDGGGTFAGLAHTIHDTAPTAELHLWVTHGLFTGRWRENLSPNYVSITAADIAPDGENSPLPHGIRSVRLLPHVLDILADITAPAAAH